MEEKYILLELCRSTLQLYQDSGKTSQETGRGQRSQEEEELNIETIYIQTWHPG